MARRRCTECRKRFAPAARALEHQRVCGEACRKRRRNRLARRRRRSDLEGHRIDELARQRKRRESLEAARCHAPASEAKRPELQRKLREMVDRITALSRATFRREAMRIVRECGAFSPSDVDTAGACHELPSAIATAEIGCRSGVSVDSVTDRHGPR